MASSILNCCERLQADLTLLIGFPCTLVIIREPVLQANLHGAVLACVGVDCCQFLLASWHWATLFLHDPCVVGRIASLQQPASCSAKSSPSVDSNFKVWWWQGDGGLTVALCCSNTRFGFSPGAILMARAHKGHTIVVAVFLSACWQLWPLYVRCSRQYTLLQQSQVNGRKSLCLHARQGRKTRSCVRKSRICRYCFVVEV